MKIFYAHPKTHYDTPQEEKDIYWLKQLGFGVLNPNIPHHQTNYGRLGMDYSDTLLESCDALAFRSFRSGIISAGVAYEIEKAKEMDIPIIKLPTLTGRILDIDATRAYMRKKGM